MEASTPAPEASPSPRSIRARLWLASSMWAPVLACNVAAIALGLGLPQIDAKFRENIPITLSTAEQIFGALAGGMITFTGIVFSAVFVAAQIQTSSYSPRVAARLRQDRIVIAALALPTATASYALFALASIGHQTGRLDQNVAPAITVVVALGLAVVTFGVFVALVQRAFDSSQIGGILRGLLRRSYHVIEEVHPAGPARVAPGERAAGSVSHELRHPGPPGVLASVDRAALARLAAETGAFVEVVPPIGDYVIPGTVTLRLRGGHVSPAERLARHVLVLSRQRTADQDPAYGLRMFVDIAIRGLSPAVNDPTTAVQAIDRIEALLMELQRRRLGPSTVLDAAGRPCGIVPGPTWDEYVALALMEIRHYGAGSAQVARRLQALHAGLLDRATPEQRPPVELERRLLAAAVAAAFPDAEEQEFMSRPDRLGLGSAP